MITTQALQFPDQVVVEEDCPDTVRTVMPDLLSRTYNALRWGQTPEEIHAMLKGEGMKDYDAWLTYKGAMLLIPKFRVGESK